MLLETAAGAEATISRAPSDLFKTCTQAYVMFLRSTGTGVFMTSMQGVTLPHPKKGQICPAPRHTHQRIQPQHSTSSGKGQQGAATDQGVGQQKSTTSVKARALTGNAGWQPWHDDHVEHFCG